VSAEPTVRLLSPGAIPNNLVEEPVSDPVRSQPAKALTQAIDVLLVDTAQAAGICGISLASWHRLRAAGKTPTPLRLSGAVRYRLEDLRLWVSWGCPSRKEFEARLAMTNGRK
jgi:predicted DNA-binding transcriptional regulator AlpA